MSAAAAGQVLRQQRDTVGRGTATPTSGVGGWSGAGSNCVAACVARCPPTRTCPSTCLGDRHPCSAACGNACPDGASCVGRTCKCGGGEAYLTPLGLLSSVTALAQCVQHILATPFAGDACTCASGPAGVHSTHCAAVAALCHDRCPAFYRDPLHCGGKADAAPVHSNNQRFCIPGIPISRAAAPAC